ncbi:MAG: HK97 family phage prohead protease [Acetobacteraceae bacterium]
MTETRFASTLPERRPGVLREIREAEGSVHVAGHPAVFNQVADIGGWFREKIMPGAFARAIREDDVPFLIEHAGLPLARNTSGTLALAEDGQGLAMDARLDGSDPDVQRIVPKMQRGDLNKMSFGFLATRQEWDETGEIPLRIIHECRLFDVSIVTMPAYAGTDIGLRSLAEWRSAHPPAKGAPVIATRLRMRLAGRTRGLAIR